MYNTLLHLENILNSIEKIELYTKEFDDAEEFYHDLKSFDATIMQFVVIGEAISRISPSFKKEKGQIPWQKIKDFRNIVAHDYFGIDAEEIWDIVKNKLLPLKYDILLLINDLNRD